ncbi:O-antigen ligase family protein [Tepidibacter sp. Z1-5]|uniref:O-antigen ligase family protein n=1 Tax=Tepidibacter sp. Z1-5 TaxID=3134138 RepID=UPI0030C28E9C
MICDNKRIDRSVILLGIILFFTPFFRGLFFEKEMYSFMLVFSILFLIISIFSIKKGETIGKLSIIEYFALGFLIIYTLSFLFAVDKGGAIYEILKNALYVCLFFIISNKVKSDCEINYLSYIYIASAVVVGIIGFGCAFKTFSYEGAFRDGIINSTFQYHNTFGAYIVGALALCMGQISNKNNIKTYVFTGMSYLLFSSLVFSYSRGAWILAPIAILLVMALINIGAIKRVLISLVSAKIGFLISFSGIYKSIESSSSKGWMYIILGTIASVVICALLDKIVSNIKKVSITKKQVFILIIGMSILGVILIFNDKFISILPTSISDRLSSINLKTFTVVERNVFYKDAVSIIKDYFIFGTGGGGWQALYPQYRTYEYTTTQTHNYIIQVFIEVGIIGVVSLIGLYLSTLYSSFKILKNDCNGNIIGVMVACVVLVAHTFIDFDMSIGSYSIFVWSMIGIVSAKHKSNESNELSVVKSKLGYIPIVLSLIILGYSCMFNLGDYSYDKGYKAFESEDYDQALKYFSKACRYKPFKEEYKIDLAKVQYHMAKKNKSKELVKEALSNMEKAININDRDVLVLTEAAQLYLGIGDLKKAEQLLDKTIEYFPLSDSAYETYINSYYELAFGFASKDMNKAKKYFSNIVDAYETVNKNNDILEERKKSILDGVENIPKGYVDDRFKIDLDENTINKASYAQNILSSLN